VAGTLSILVWYEQQLPPERAPGKHYSISDAVSATEVHPCKRKVARFAAELQTCDGLFHIVCRHLPETVLVNTCSSRPGFDAMVSQHPPSSNRHTRDTSTSSVNGEGLPGTPTRKDGGITREKAVQDPGLKDYVRTCRHTSSNAGRFYYTIGWSRCCYIASWCQWRFLK
jgi:hypothetical protein